MSKAPLRAGKAQLPAPKEDRSPESGPSAAETARYIGEFTAELAFMARQAKLDLLVYLLDMARMEASRAARSGRRA